VRSSGTTTVSSKRPASTTSPSTSPARPSNVTVFREARSSNPVPTTTTSAPGRARAGTTSTTDSSSAGRRVTDSMLPTSS
jgi:hypothetical protein